MAALQVHILLEACIKRCMSKEQSVSALRRLGVEPLFAQLGKVGWGTRARLEALPASRALRGPAWRLIVGGAHSLALLPAVWERLEQENPEFFASYNTKLAALVSSLRAP